MPTNESISTALAIAPLRSRCRCRATASAIWSPQVKTGLSEVIGSWKIIEMSLPRTSRRSSSGSVTRSRPSSRIWPATIRPGRLMSPRMDMAVMLLPQPDSPTTPSVFPSPMVKLIPSTALTVPSCVKKWVLRPLTSSSVPTASGRPARRPSRMDAVTCSPLAGGGSSASRRPSPRKLAARTTSTIVTDGYSRIQGRTWRSSSKFLSRLPRLASGGLMPKPRKDRAASATTESAMPSVAATTTGARAAGRMWRAMIRRFDAPSARAACTKSASRNFRNSARTSRQASVQPVKPIAMITTRAEPLPRTATMMRIMKKTGSERITSTNRMIRLSIQPP